MTIRINTPAGTPFEFEVNGENIIITTQNNSQHAYALRSLRDLFLWLKNDCNGGWILLGTKGEEEIPNTGTVEEWARSPNNPINGFYGLTPGRSGRFSSYIPSILEYFGFVELEHNQRNNRIRSL